MEDDAGTGSESVGGRLRPGNDVNRTLMILCSMIKTMIVDTR